LLYSLSWPQTHNPPVLASCLSFGITGTCHHLQLECGFQCQSLYCFYNAMLIPTIISPLRNIQAC
jgi:hypothetical protein